MQINKIASLSMHPQPLYLISKKIKHKTIIIDRASYTTLLNDGLRHSCVILVSNLPNSTCDNVNDALAIALTMHPKEVFIIGCEDFGANEIDGEEYLGKQPVAGNRKSGCLNFIN